MIIKIDSKKTSLALILLAMLPLGCGAPSKDAGAVMDIFSLAPASLQQKTTDLCASLGQRSAQPTLQKLDLDDQNCADAGSIAVDFKTAKSFNVKMFDSATSPTATKDSMIINMRSQVWLGTKFLTFALTMLSRMQDGSLISQNGDASSLLDDKNGSGDTMSNLLKPQIKEIEAPTIDMTSMTFAAKISFQAQGIVTVNNNIDLAGGIIGDAVALTIVTPAEAGEKDSFLRSFSLLVLIIPYADDVYLDMFVRAKIFDLGIKSLLPDVTGTALKVIIGKLMALQ